MISDVRAGGRRCRPGCGAIIPAPISGKLIITGPATAISQRLIWYQFIIQ
jgi:hypothetical protein